MQSHRSVHAVLANSKTSELQDKSGNDILLWAAKDTWHET